MFSLVFIDKKIKLVEKAVINELDLSILDDDNWMLKSIENELVLLLGLQSSMNSFYVTITKFMHEKYKRP